MITVITSIADQLSQLSESIRISVSEPELTRVAAAALVPVIRERIHVDGKAADGSQIGTYSEGYMAVRTGKFKSNGIVSKGKRKGETRSQGTVTRGPRKGQPRPSYNRTSDTTVVLSLTRQMENDLSVQPTETGYGIGFSNAENAAKAKYAEENYDKKIYALSTQEEELAIGVIVDYLNNSLT
jgi:hypothetical protein